MTLAARIVDDGVASSRRRMPSFISIAFAATVLFVPLVVSIGLATDGSLFAAKPPSPGPLDLAPDLRGSLGTEAFGLRGSD